MDSNQHRAAHQQYPPLLQSEDYPVGPPSRDRQPLWTLSMRRPLANKQPQHMQAAHERFSREDQPQHRGGTNNHDDNALFHKVNDLSLADGATEDGRFVDHAANANSKPSHSYHDDGNTSDFIIARTDPIHDSFQTPPPPMVQNSSSTFEEAWQQQPSWDDRKLLGRSCSLNTQCDGVLPTSALLAGAPFLPTSPDFASDQNHFTTKSIRFPNPMFSPMAGNGTEFRLQPLLVVAELSAAALVLSPPPPATRLLRTPPPPPPLMPLSPELMVRPHRALKMRKTAEGLVHEIIMLSG
jgi:hypothetical protein